MPKKRSSFLKKVFNSCFPFIFGVFLALIFIMLSVLLGLDKVSRTKVGGDLINSLTNQTSSSNTSK